MNQSTKKEPKTTPQTDHIGKANGKVEQKEECKHYAVLKFEGEKCIKCEKKLTYGESYPYLWNDGKVAPQKDWEKEFMQKIIQLHAQGLTSKDYVFVSFLMDFIRILLAQQKSQLIKEIEEWAEEHMLVEIPLTRKLKDFLQTLLKT